VTVIPPFPSFHPRSSEHRLPPPFIFSNEHAPFPLFFLRFVPRRPGLDLLTVESALDPILADCAQNCLPRFGIYPIWFFFWWFLSSFFLRFPPLPDRFADRFFFSQPCQLPFLPHTTSPIMGSICAPSRQPPLAFSSVDGTHFFLTQYCGVLLVDSPPPYQIYRPLCE